MNNQPAIAEAGLEFLKDFRALFEKMIEPMPKQGKPSVRTLVEELGAAFDRASQEQLADFMTLWHMATMVLKDPDGDIEITVAPMVGTYPYGEDEE